MGNGEIAALTLRNIQAARLLSGLISDGRLGGFTSGILIDHQGELDCVWAVLQPDSPSVLPFSFEQWKQAIGSFCTKGILLDDLDSALQCMEFSAQNNDPSVEVARQDWEDLCALVGKGYSLDACTHIAAKVREKFENWPQSVKARIGSLEEKLEAMRQSVEFEVAVGSAAGIAASNSR